MTRSLIPNSTQVPDVILDYWMAALSGAEFKVLLYVARRTYGFGKESDAISLSQLAAGIRRRDGSRLDRGTGLSRSAVKAACNGLIALGLLIRSANITADGREPAESTYRLNLFAPIPAGGDGVGQNSADPGRKKAHPGRESAGGGPESDRGVGWKVAPQETGQETGQETAAGERRSAADRSDGAAAGIASELVGHGVGRAVAEQLAAEKPDVCRRCLEYLPFARVRTTPGAWLADAVRREYGPPDAFLKREWASREGGGREPPARNGEHAVRVSLARARTTLSRLEDQHPEVVAAFAAHVSAERERAERFAARLSEHRRSEYLAAFDAEECRLALFDRWWRAEGRRLGLSPAAGPRPASGATG